MELGRADAVEHQAEQRRLADYLVDDERQCRCDGNEDEELEDWWPAHAEQGQREEKRNGEMEQIHGE